MLRSHHHLRGFVKLVLWDAYCVSGCGSFRLGYVGVGFGGNCDCRCGILYVPMLGVVFAGLVILASSPYSPYVLLGASPKLILHNFLLSVIGMWWMPSN